MACVSLQMIFLGSMLIFNDHTSSSSSSSSSSCSAAAVPSRCMSEEDVKDRGGKFEKKYWNKTGDLRQEDANKTCEQAVLEMRGRINRRSLSPWRYRLDRKDDRFPRDIFIAECLCKGCITEQREDPGYNSVLVLVPLMVLNKIPCPRDRDKYKLEKEFINVPVACTCVVPKYSK